MSSLNGVMKAIESLNQHQDSQNIDQPLRKDEKMSYCSAIVYGISCPSVRSARNFSQVLSLSIKTLLDVCADADSDVRTVADECLNKIIRSISDGNILKVQFEFYNEIHRNGNCLSLRAALRHFGLLSHTIKPAKGKPYISNLVPCIEAISRRTEESLIETLSQSLPWILKSLGIFMTDRDVKTLLKAFYPNLSSPHAFFRRNAANMILTTCIYCPKPKISLFYVLRYLIDTLITISNVEEKSHLVVGSLICFRIMLPYIDDLYNDDSEFNTHEFDSLLQIYTLCLRFIQWHSDHNVVNAGLETLAQLFRTNNQELLTLLTSRTGIPIGDSKVVSVQETIRLPSNDSTSNENVKDVNLSKSSELNHMNDTTETKTKLNIGSFNDSDVPLKYCCRYLASTFLLGGTPGQLVPDEVFRVSVKSLALTCIGAIVRLYPDIFFKRLEKKFNVNETDDQMVSDVLLYAEHCDPQLRGNVSMIVAYLLNTVYIKYRVSYNEFRTRISQGQETEFHKLEYLIGIFAKALDDESAITCRQALVALNICLSSLLESPDSIQGITLIYRLLPLSDNLYFLVKMNLVQVLSELPYITINYLTSSSQFQEDVLSTFIKLLSDQDPRVRQAASDAIVKFVEVAYYKNPYEDEVIRKASYCTEQQYLNRVISTNQMETPTYNVEYNFFVSGLIEPYSSFYLDKCCSPYRRKKVENSLSIVISLLVEKLPAHSSKYLAYGCFQTLCQLSQSYPTSLYSGAWDCKLPKILSKRNNSILYSSNRNINNDNNIDISILDDPLSPISVKLLSLILSLVVSDPVSLDLATHRHLITLAGNLLSGISLKQIKTINVNERKETVDNGLKMWNLFDSIEINNYFELLFKHIMRLIQIYVHVINDIQIPSSYNKSTFASFPTIQSISPRKKLGVQVDHKLKDRSEKGPANSSKFGKESESYFYDTPHYVKLYDILQAAHLNYNSTIDTDASQMYLGLLNAALEVLSQILEISSTYEARKVAEEILRCLESTLSLSVTMTIQCVRQLLKSLFEMNFSVRWSEFEDIKSVDQLTKGSPEDIRRLYDRCFQKSSKQMAEFIKSIGNNCQDNQCDVEKSRNSITKRKDSHHKLAMLFKSFTQSNNQKAFFATFIRIFEPMVIKSLNLYTTTNSVSCQCQVLSLLSQLVQFHVNYCLLDTDKTFINFVLSQFSFIEESKILQVDNLLPKIFTFFVHLSYEKFHTKMVIEIREIIKLCDGLMASGQPPATHCIPALIPVVEDIFLTRSKFLTSATDHAELDTTREYLMSMMLRLVEHDKILELLARCLQKCRYSENGEEKWKKWSRMIIDAILPALSSGNIKVECESVMTALIKLFSVISPVVLRPVDPLLKIFFMAPPVTEDSLIKFERWLGRVNVIFLALVSYNKEENILTRLSELTASMKDIIDNLNLFDFPTIYSDISNPFDAESCLLSPEEIFVLFIFKVMSISAMKIYLIVNSMEYCDKFMKLQQNSCLFHELVFFIKLCIHIFESGTYCKITSAAKTMVKVKTIYPVKQLNQFMLDVSKRHNPFLAIQWVQMMAILEYNEMSFWSKFLEIKSPDECNVNNSIHRSNNDEIISIDSKLSHQCTIILFCNYICENTNDVESLSWLIINHIEEIVHLGNESPMSDFVTAVIQKNSEVSKIFVQEISARCLYRSDPSFIKKLLQILDCAHKSLSGEVVLTLLPFLSSSRITLAKMSAQISRKRIKLLLSLNPGQVFEQLSREKFSGLIKILNSEKFIKKYRTLVDLVNVLDVKFYDIFPIKEDHQHFDSQTCKQIPLDKKWFISQVRFRCSQASQPVEFSECAELLSNLSRENCDEIVMSEEFNLKILRECIKLGVQITLKDYINNIVFIKGDNNIPEPKYGDQLYSECLSSLYLSTKECLFRHVQSINESIPNPHVVYNPIIEDNVKDGAVQYAMKFRALMKDKTYREKLFEIIPAVTMYMKSLRQFSDQDILCIDATFNQELVKFSTLCLEVINWMIHSKHESIDCFKPHYLDLCLNCSIKILQNQDICQIFGNANHYTWVCSAVNVLTKLVEFWHSPKKSFSSTSSYLSKQECLPKIDKGSLVAALENESTKVFADACLQMASLITWVEKTEFKNKEKVIPSFVKNSIITLVVIISRQELVNSFALTPPLVWKHGWHIQGSGATMCHFPLLLSTTESNFLQEMNVLRQFVHRITLLGWTSRHQFEEIWMALLSVLSASSSENKLVNGIDDVANNEATILAVQGITRLLMQTLLLLYPGYPINSSIMHHTRDRPLSLKKTASKRLYVVQNLLSCQYEYMKEFNMSDCLFKDVTKPLDCEHLFTRGNIERDTVNNGYDYFSYSQLSVQYLWSSCSLHEDKLSASVLKLKDKRNQSLDSNYLDLDSCVRFLIEFYSRWMLSYANTFPRLLNEVVKSIVAISELFVERNQFQWMFDTCWEMKQFHPIDDEILHHSLIFAICKAAAVLIPLDIESLEKIKQVIDQGLKLTYFPCQVATLHGILYLLQSAVQAKCEETINVIHPIAVNYIQNYVDAKQFSDVTLNQCEQHQQIVWALIYFLHEHIKETTSDIESLAVLELASTLTTLPRIPVALHRTLVQGFERLIATRNVTGREADQIVKLSLERLKQPNILFVIPALRLLLTCMYTEAAGRINETTTSTNEQLLLNINPETLMMTIEKTSAIFDRIKRGYPGEVKILCYVLTEILEDFFPPFEILTKVISEFLSPQQPHQKLIASIVSKICERVASNVDQLTFFQDWVIFSLPNFIQSLPAQTFTWCLSCFFISASTNPWLRALFPYIQSRIGKDECEDRNILFISSLDFFQKLSNESQKEAFISCFSTADTELTSPFREIVTSLQSINN
ncbi:huntingtin [Microplitis mediator]|uniref:huntingtin n=1 Tax=Microplitis mediator TaxID=375433 RepID=UPI002552474E|nr:huntingtin [Microplitis mediator]XP_057330594.1 huntingtin [Microplitis mediator]